MYQSREKDQAKSSRHVAESACMRDVQSICVQTCMTQLPEAAAAVQALLLAAAVSQLLMLA